MTLIFCLTLTVTPFQSVTQNTPFIITSQAAYNKATIKNVQKELNDLGYDCGTPDGIVGKSSKSAIKSYQKEKKLKVTGTVTKSLLKSLKITETKSTAPAKDTLNKSTKTVYVTKTGSKYHLSGCRYLRQSKISISLPEAQKYYEPCSVCNP